MVMQSVADDGVQVIIPGWTNQSTTPYTVAVESSGGGTLGLAETPAGNGYLGWSLIPEDAISNAFSPTTTDGYLTRIVASTGGPCGHLDFVLHTVGTNTNVVFGLYSGASFATGPLAYTADVHASLATGLNSIPWGTPSTVQLQAGQTYWIYMEITTSAAGTFAGSTASGAFAATIMNVNLTASASYADNSMVLATSAPSTLTGSTVLTPQTNWATQGSKIWFGLKA